MLSSFTNQVSGLIGSATGGKKDTEGGVATATTTGEPSTSTTDPATTATATATEKGSALFSNLTSSFGNLIGRSTAAGASTTESSAVDTMATSQSTGAPDTTTTSSTSTTVLSSLSSVKNHIPSWLLGKSGAGAETTGEPAQQQQPPLVPPKDRERDPTSKASTPSSATGGADDPDKMKDLQEGNIDKVKSIGSYLFSSVKAAGQKIKETNLLENFQREHDTFLKGKTKGEVGLPPWTGHPKEELLRDEIIGLSSDRRNFLRSPPPGVPFVWEWSDYEPIARAILKEDPALEQMRYDLVPKLISEELFWRNYFYRVMLLKESMESTTAEGATGDSSSSRKPPRNDSEIEQELNEELRSFEIVGDKPGKFDDKELESLLDLK